MSWNIVEGNWKQFKGMIKGRWGKVTDDLVDEMAGKGEILAEKAQETYGAAQGKVEKTVVQVEEQSKK